MRHVDVSIPPRNAELAIAVESDLPTLTQSAVMEIASTDSEREATHCAGAVRSSHRVAASSKLEGMSASIGDFAPPVWQLICPTLSETLYTLMPWRE